MRRSGAVTAREPLRLVAVMGPGSDRLVPPLLALAFEHLADVLQKAAAGLCPLAGNAMKASQAPAWEMFGLHADHSSVGSCL